MDPTAEPTPPRGAPEPAREPPSPPTAACQRPRPALTETRAAAAVVVSIRQLALLALVLVAATLLLAFAWKFGLEEYVDPFLPGNHQVESRAERWEFVAVSTLFVALVSGLMLLFGRHTLRQLESAQRRQALVYDGFISSREPLLVLDGERVIVAENRRAAELFGPYQGPLAGRHFHDLVPIDLTDATYLGMELAIRDPGTWRGKVRFVHPTAPLRVDLGLRVRRDRMGNLSSIHARVFGIEQLDDDGSGLRSHSRFGAADDAASPPAPPDDPAADAADRERR